ncbi:MAG: hypothetical protein WD750_07075 [Gammaproteobacteria bacterium]
MISSLISKFKFTHRRVLFLSAHKAAVYHWYGNDIGSSYLFDTNEEGRAYFERYLHETEKLPTYILTDFFEEEFRQDTVPHVYGPDRRALLERKKGRLFRDTPYFYSRVIDREQEGRRDDRILMTALTNPDLVRPWVQLLDNYKVPLAGIYSVALVTESLLKLFDNPSKHLLMVSLQSLSGLRQTFFHDKQFRISRLITMPRYGTEPYAPHIAEEVEKIRRYLNSMRLISQEDPLEICFLLSADLLEELKKEHEDSSLVQYSFYDVDQLLKSAGSSQTITTPFSDKLFAHQLLKQKPGNFYASSKDRRYFTMRGLRHAMTVSGALLLLGGAAWSGFNLMDGLTFKQNSLTAENKAEFYDQRYQMARERLPATPVEAQDLKVAVDLVETLHQYKTTPLRMVQVISAVAGAHPDIRVDDFQWTASIDPNLNTGGGAAAGRGNTPRPGEIGYSNVSDRDTGYDYYQIARIEGHLEPFNGDYRKAIAVINEFVEELGGREGVYDVSILNLPLDVSSDASLQGNTGAEGKDARFSIRVVLGIRHAA